jgi:hypothetical protein
MPDNTLVDFVIGAPSGEVTDADAQRLTLGDFRRRLVSALISEEPMGPPPKRPTDTEALQLHIGVRYLLLAPLYGYSLRELRIEEAGSTIELLHDGVEESFGLAAFQNRIRSHVREELDRVQRASGRGAIDLAKVAEAEAAAKENDSVRVLELLGTWPAPLAIFLRTPEGQLLSAETRAHIAKGLGLLGSACISLGEVEKGEEVLRLAVQYAGDGAAAHDIYLRLGVAMLDDNRPGEAVGPLRRAANLGADGKVVWPLLARALVLRRRFVAALGAVLEAKAAGASGAGLDDAVAEIEAGLGATLGAWRTLVQREA